MKTYLSDIIPKVKRFSEKLDNITLLMGNHWIVLDEDNDRRMVYIFRENNQLLISNNGRVTKANWEYLGNNSLLIDNSEGSFLFNLGFFDENIIALKVDSRNEYAFLINENRIEDISQTVHGINKYLAKNYITQTSNISNDSNFSKKQSGFLVPFQTNKGEIEALLPNKDHYPLPGVKVFKNGQNALNGKYKLGFMHFIHVKNGEVKKVTFF